MVVCVVVLAVLAVLWLGSRHGARAASGDDRVPAEPATLQSVVVGRHDTLWDIAVRTRPGADPRVTVQRMIDLNSLPNAIVQPGQRVLVPAG